jgi:hypothetical protein
MGKSSSPPPAPDYAGAATAQGVANREVADQQTWANRPTINTPWGKQAWQTGTGVDPATGKTMTSWEQTTTLDPKAQAALDSQVALQQGRSDLAGQRFGDVSRELGTSPDYSGIPDYTRLQGTGAEARDRGEASIMGRFEKRMDPRWNQREQALEAKLANQGLVSGSEAHRRAMEQFGQERTDAYEGAQAQAIQQGGTEAQRQQGIEQNLSTSQNQQRQAMMADLMQRRGWSLNEANALMSGQQVGMPQQPGFQQAQMAQAAPIFGAAQATGQAQNDAYSAKQAQQNSKGAGMGSLGGAALSMAPLMFSDRRLKADVEQVGETRVSVPLYSFRYKWEPEGTQHVGVMSDEVPDDMVREHPSGFDMVDYSRVEG